jgi:general secretion pathway protein G
VKNSWKSLLLLLFGLGIAGLVGVYFLFDPTPNISVAKQVAVKADLTLLKKKVADYRNRNGVYPETEQWRQALGLGPSAKDPWGNEYVYRNPGKRSPLEYDFFSAGPDRLPDTADDDWGQ